MNESMIERVARAIFSDRYPGEDWKEYQKRDYCGHARAAIEAMRWPTCAMLEPEVVSRTEDRLDGTHQVNYLVPVMDIWPKMIDAALSTPNTDKT